MIKRLWKPRERTERGLRIQEGFLDEGHIQGGVLNESAKKGDGMCSPIFHGEATQERLRRVEGLEAWRAWDSLRMERRG